MKKIIALILTFLFLIIPICSCKKQGDVITSETNNISFSLTKETLCEYLIIIPEDSDNRTKNIAEQLSKSIKRITNKEPKIKSDFTVEGSAEYCENEYEILLGLVDRDQVDKLYSDIRENDFGYAMINKKIVLIGRNPSSLDKSYDLFVSEILKDANTKDVLMNDGYNKQVKAEYLFDQMTLNGVGINEYKIVYPLLSSIREESLARYLQSYIRTKTGYTIDCVSDKTEPTKYEIQIGQTNRITNEMIYLRSETGFGEGKYYISFSENGVWISGKTTLELNAAINNFTEKFKIDGTVAVLNENTCLSYSVKELSISTLTYNVLYDFSQPRNPDNVLRSLEEENTDIFGLNEVTEEWITRLTNKFDSIYTCSKGEASSNDKHGEYSPIFFKTEKFELLESGTKWLSDTPDRISKYKESYLNRILNYVVLRDKETGISFMYVQVHFENTREGYDSATARKKQSAVAKSFTDEYQNLPIIIGGDMNTNSTKELSPLLLNTRFSNAPTVAKEKKESGTWVGKDFSSIGEVVFDYIFVTPDSISVSKYEAVDNMFDGKYPSDHIPVRVDAVIYR